MGLLPVPARSSMAAGGGSNGSNGRITREGVAAGSSGATSHRKSFEEVLHLHSYSNSNAHAVAGSFGKALQPTIHASRSIYTPSTPRGAAQIATGAGEAQEYGHAEGGSGSYAMLADGPAKWRLEKQHTVKGASPPFSPRASLLAADTTASTFLPALSYRRQQ